MNGVVVVGRRTAMRWVAVTVGMLVLAMTAASGDAAAAECVADAALANLNAPTNDYFGCFPGVALADQPRQRIIELIDYALLQRNNGIVGDGDAFRANFGAAFGDVAVADPKGGF